MKRLLSFITKGLCGKISWIVLAAMLPVSFWACSADYDTFGTSDYCELKEISFMEQKGDPAIYSREHRMEFDLLEIPDSLDTWDSITIAGFDMSHFASLHLVDTEIGEFPKDSLALDSLAESVDYETSRLRKQTRIPISANQSVFLLVLSESGNKSIWQLNFSIPEKRVSSSSVNSSNSFSKSSSSSIAYNSSSSGLENPADSTLPEILSLFIAGKEAQIERESKTIHLDSLEYLADLTRLELSELTLSEGANADVTVGEYYDFGTGISVTVTGANGMTRTYFVKAGYQIPGSNLDVWKNNDVVPDSIWGNANTILTTTEKMTEGSVIGAKITTGAVLSKIASGSLYTADFNPNGISVLSMASASTWPDGNELLDFGKPFKARPEYMEVKFSYKGSGDSCDVYILLENRTGDKNVNRKSSDVNKLVASAWFRSSSADGSGHVNPDVVSISDADENGLRTFLLKLQYGDPLPGSPIERSSVFNTSLQSKNAKAINNGLVQGSAEDLVTHVRIVFASSADGNHYKGVKDATLIIDSVRLIYGR